MKYMVYFMFALFLFSSCKREREPQPVPEELTKLERLYRIRPDSVMKSYDLSNDSLTELPDLSKYVISSLDLSHNLLDTIIPERLPLGIEWLNVSHNNLKGYLLIKEETIPALKELDVSYNRLTKLRVDKQLRRVIASHNQLDKIILLYIAMQYVDISYNPNLSECVSFAPEKVDTLLHEGIASDKPLVSDILGREWY